LGVTAAIALAVLARPIGFNRVLVVGLTATAVLMLVSHVLFTGLYERLLYKQGYTSDMAFKDVVENRSGVIAVSRNETVFGGGVYDGAFNTDPVNDSNGIFRAYAIAGLHPKPKQVLVIGLASGSWAQVLANHPEVQKMTMVEINPGYLPLIRGHSAVSGLLRNPAVEIAIDDGRRWLLAHPDRKFDFVLMNTTFHWRANVSNLLSREFLKLLRSHLNRGGIAYYNTTWSGEVQATGCAEFPYALRIANFLAVSDSPISVDQQLWRKLMINYKIDGKPVFNLANGNDQSRLAEILRVADEPEHQPRSQGTEIESRAELLARWKGYRLITDDNMGAEWR
jgi:spermidine synthase